MGNSPELDPASFVYGFGRRRCPGIELARTTCLLMMASSLSVLDIIKARDEQGHEQVPVHGFISGTVWYVVHVTMLGLTDKLSLAAILSRSPVMPSLVLVTHPSLFMCYVWRTVVHLSVWHGMT
jgi:hypothetical protein